MPPVLGAMIRTHRRVWILSTISPFLARCTALHSLPSKKKESFGKNSKKKKYQKKFENNCYKKFNSTCTYSNHRHPCITGLVCCFLCLGMGSGIVAFDLLLSSGDGCMYIILFAMAGNTTRARSEGKRWHLLFSRLLDRGEGAACFNHV